MSRRRKLLLRAVREVARKARPRRRAQIHRYTSGVLRFTDEFGFERVFHLVAERLP